MTDLLYRIFNRVIILSINGADYKISAPDCRLRYYAELHRQKILNDYKYDLPLLEDYIRFLIKMHLVDADYENKIKNMSDTIKRFKLQLFQVGPKIEQAKKIRKNLELMKKKINQYITDIEFYKRPTLEYFADTQKNKFILINTVYNKQEELVFNQIELNTSLLNIIIDKLNQEDISSSSFREIARSDDWRAYWNVDKNNVFGIPPLEYSEDQKVLCSFSRMYDNMFEHPECPEENVINDDDLTDGWFLFQREKNTKDKKQEFLSHIDDRFTEVFSSAENQDEANSIYSINNQDGDRILRERAAVLKQKEEVRDLDFKDVQLDFIETKSKTESAFMKNIGG